MEIDELINKVESVIKEERKKFENSDSKDERFLKNEAVYLITPYFLRFFKVLFYHIPKAFKIAKNDFLIYGVIMGILGVLFIFFTILWFSVSAAFGIYFYEKGFSLFISVLVSIGFQLLSFALAVFLIYLSTRKLRSIKMIKSIEKHIK
jgi:hypothetical protein